jgi:hypothetical protein
MLVIDGTNILLLGVNRSKTARNTGISTRPRDGSLKKVLLLVEWALLCDRSFQVFFDRTTPYAVPDHERDLFAILLTDFKKFFKIVDSPEADQEILLLAKTTNGVVISNDRFRKKNRSGGHWLDIHPWLAEPERTIFVHERNQVISLGSLDVVELTESEDAFDVYNRIAPFLRSEL